MLNDLIGSKRINSNIKATINQQPQTSNFQVHISMFVIIANNIFNYFLSLSSFHKQIGDASSGVEVGDSAISMDVISATIISSNFWPPIQVCSQNYFIDSFKL